MYKPTVVLLLAIAVLSGPKAAKLGAQEISRPGDFSRPLAAGSDAAAAPYNDLIVDQIQAMPVGGGYSAASMATHRLCSAVQLDPGGLAVDSARAQPSYCSGATYLLFLNTVEALVRTHRLPGNAAFLAPLLIAGQPDGQGVWGRWNANGPGTARLFHELDLGPNFTDRRYARAGDFMKVFWSDAVGQREHGHSVVYLGTETTGGVESVRFWSSNLHLGYGDKAVPASRLKAVLFSRLLHPENLAKAADLGTRPDSYLASLLSSDSSFEEACAKTGASARP